MIEHWGVSGQREYFVPGTFVLDGGGSMAGQIFVQELWSGEGGSSAIPLLFIHGGGLTGHVWMRTADGRAGWAPTAVARGYDVCVIDQPNRGRSGFSSDLAESDFRRLSALDIEKMFTACAHHDVYPGAQDHTQWPGSGRRGDPIFDQFFASIVPFHADLAASQRNVRDAMNRLLQSVGASVLVTHSQSGPQGWVIADAVPDYVRAIIALEPSGPPGYDYWSLQPSRSYGITDIPLADMGEDSRDADPVEVLRNLTGIPILVITASASHHARFDDDTVAYLKRGGMDVTHLKLAEIGIVGNGHMMQIENNSTQILDAALAWLESVLPVGSS